MILKRGLIIGLIALFAAPGLAMAQNASPPPPVDVTGLSAAQIAEIQAQVEAKKTETPVGQARATVEAANEWINIGEGIGAGVAAAARETGQVVNEFADTPVGKMTTFVILYKVIGKDIIGLIVGTILLIAFVSIWLVYTNKMFSKEKTITINADKSKVIEYRDKEWSEGSVGACMISVAVLLIVSALLLIVILP